MINIFLHQNKAIIIIYLNRKIVYGVFKLNFRLYVIQIRLLYVILGIIIERFLYKKLFIHTFNLHDENLSASKNYILIK